MLKKLSLVLAMISLVACGAEDDINTSSGNDASLNGSNPLPTSQPNPISTDIPNPVESGEPNPVPIDGPDPIPTFGPNPVPSPVASGIPFPTPTPLTPPISASPTPPPSGLPTPIAFPTPVPQPTEEPINPPNPSVGDFDLVQGKLYYETFCLECHGSVGRGSLSFSVPIHQANYDALMNRADGGNMPTGRGPVSDLEYSPEQCVGDCAHQVAGYITSGFSGADDNGGDGTGSEVGFDGCSQPEGAPASRAVRLLTRREYQNSINDIFNLDLELTTNFLPEGRDHGFTNNADIAQVTALHLDHYYDAATRVTERVADALNGGAIRDEINCSANFQCIRTFVERFGMKLFRRPLEGFEIDEYMSFFTVLRPDGQDDNFFNHSDRFKEAIAAGLPALLMSPNFIYRKEFGQQSADVYRLDDYEMATLIAYTFTGSTPDDILLLAARNQQVRTKPQFKAQAERLLGTQRGQDQMAHFAVEWWDAGLELIGSKNPDFYDGYTPEVIQSMVGEMRAFFKHVVFESTGKFQELYQPGYTMLDATLSQFYGIGNVTGDDFTKVITNQRGGILSFGAIMAANASTEESSPIKRGVFVREQLMCDPLPPLPRDVNIPNPDLDPTKPIRERFEAHSINPNCWACHKYFDDIGFAMESYDASGQFRDQEVMYDLDTHEVIDYLDILTQGKVIDVDAQDEHYFDDLSGLSSIMAQSDSTKSCMTTQYYRYVMGYTISQADSCAITNLNKTFVDSEFDIQSLLIGITQLDSFSLRK